MNFVKPLILSAAFVAAHSALAEPLTVYKSVVGDMPIMEARFNADLDKGTAWVDVITTREAPERVYLDENLKLRDSKYDDFEMTTTVKRSQFALSLDRASGELTLDVAGEKVVCATARKKHFLLVPYTKVKETGRCKLNAYVNVDVNEDRHEAIVELEVK